MTVTDLHQSFIQFREPRVANERVGFMVSEQDEGATDLNGDGDADDRVLHFWQNGQVQNTGLAVWDGDVDYDERFTAVAVSESAQGLQDLNADGDAFDNVLFLTTPTSPLAANQQLSAYRLSVQGGLIAFTVPESSQGGVDLNGDGDISDRVIHGFDPRRGTIENLHVATENIWTETDAVTFTVWESQQGSDLSGDGDLNDRVLFYVGRR